VCQGSTVVEHSTHNPKVEGSNHTSDVLLMPIIKFQILCAENARTSSNILTHKGRKEVTTFTKYSFWYHPELVFYSFHLSRSS
jgi:hypothetical protein